MGLGCPILETATATAAASYGVAKLAAALLSNPQVRNFWRGFRERKVLKVPKHLQN